jgi:predicted kinase
MIAMVAPRLIVFAGLPGTGKSTLAREVARRWEATWLRVDTAEAAMLKAGLPLSDETGLAAYIIVRDAADEQLGVGLRVVIDAVNGVEEAREMWRELARDHGVIPFVVEVVCSDAREHRRRVESRVAPRPPLPLPTWVEVQNRKYLPWREPIMRVDSVDPLEDSVAQILEKLAAKSGRVSPPVGKSPLRRKRRTAR